MQKEKQWYIVYTQTGKEIKTLYTLSKKHIECFCPLTTSFVNGSNKNVENPILPNYIFVHILPDECTAIRKMEGVINFMHWLDKCVVVEDEDIVLLKEITGKYKFLKAENIKVNPTLSSTTYWKTVPVTTDNGINEEEDIMTVSFPAYGFAVAAKESKVNVRVINIHVSKDRPMRRMQYKR